jgi:diacylglycerol kinase
LTTAWREERNFRVQIAYGLSVFVLLCWLRPPLVSCLLSVATVGALLVAELFNSALERTVDLACPEDHPLACKAKDLAAGGVMITSFVSAGTVFLVLAKNISTEVFISLGVILFSFLAVRFEGGAEL